MAATAPSFTSGFVPINRSPVSHHSVPPLPLTHHHGHFQHGQMLPPQTASPQNPIQSHAQAERIPPSRLQPMDIDDDDADSNATISEMEDGHFQYKASPETIDLSRYYSSLPLILSAPTGPDVPYPTSVEVATLIMNVPLRVRPLYDQDDMRHDGPFMERLFNFGGMIGKGGHQPLFTSSTGEYKFFQDRDRDLAAQHGFPNEESLFKYLDDLKGTGHVVGQDMLRFSTPWHEIDVVFEPRKRGQVEPGTSRRKAKGKAAAAAVESPEHDDTLASPTEPAPDDTHMTNGDDTTELDTTTLSTTTPPGDPSPALPPAPPAINPVTGRPIKKYQPPKKIPIHPTVHPIPLEDLIHAVTRHPLLLPWSPVTVDFIIASAPHLLQNVGLLYVLAHGELENEGLSEKLGRLGLDVAPNVLAHRKKKALVDMGGAYRDRKAGFEAYKKGVRRRARGETWKGGIP